MSKPDDWRRGFAKQAHADFVMWTRLQRMPDVVECHKLHFLQMACEKLAKAFLCRAGSDPNEVQSSHAYTAKQLPLIARDQMFRLTGKTPKRFDPKLQQIRLLAREIELLSPAVRQGDRRPDNCEYPWELGDGKIRVPAEHSFPHLRLLHSPIGQMLLKCVHEAILELA